MSAPEPWDDEDRADCLREWEQRVFEAIDSDVDEGLDADASQAMYEAGLQVLRELRALKKEVSRAK